MSLLELEVILHIGDLCLVRHFVLAGHVLLHVIEQSHDGFLLVAHLLGVLCLVYLVLCGEFIDLLLFLVKDFVLCALVTWLASSVEVSVDLIDVLLQLVDCLLNVCNLPVLLLDLGIFFFDAVHKAFSCLREWEVGLIGLEFKVLFLLL